MRGVGVTCLLAGALGACGDNELRERCLDPDRPHALRLRVYGDAIELLAVRYGADEHDWLERRDDGDYELCAADDVLVTLVCIDPYDGSRVVEQHGLVASQEAEVPLYACAPRRSTEADLVLVRLDVAQAGMATIEGHGRGDSFGPWTADYYVREGRRELVASTAFPDLSASPRLVRRPIDVRAPLTLVAVDIEAEGEPVAEFRFDVTGLAATDRVQSLAYLHTATSLARIGEAKAASLPIAPPHLVRADEHQDLVLQANTVGDTRSYFRTASLEHRGGESLTFELLPQLETVTVLGTPTGPAVRRAELPADTDRVELYASTPFMYQRATYSRGWLDRRGGALVTLDLDVPGFDPTWIAPATDGSVQIEADRGELRLESAVRAPLER